jgi:RHS repeat-associated protein
VFATNTAGVKTWTASYDPFGGVRTTTGTPINARFPGQWFQAESGLHQNWMRDYDPTTGRYLQADPLGLVDGASVYGYAGQNPIRNTDPTGECFGLLAYVCAAAGGAVGGVVSGYLIDKYFGDGCYTWEEARRDALFGAFGGAAFKAIGVGYGAWRGAAAAAAAKSAAQGAAASALAKATPIGSALKDDIFHRSASWARDLAVRNGKHFSIVGGDGVTRTLTQVLGGLNDKAGRFEYLVDSAGNLTHQLFVAGGKITGIPIVP